MLTIIAQTAAPIIEVKSIILIAAILSFSLPLSVIILSIRSFRRSAMTAGMKAPRA
jgi:hypothetical protein